MLLNERVSEISDLTNEIGHPMEANKSGWLPIYVSWQDETQSYICSVGSYAVKQFFKVDTNNIKAFCVPYVQNVPFSSVQQLETLLRSCGNSEEVISIICHEGSPESWIKYFWS
jgi:hypothetical protein